MALQGIQEQANIGTQQQSNINALTAQAQGTGPSLAQDTLQNATDRNIQQITGQVASQRGVPVGLGLRAGVNAIGNANQKSASDAATLRLQEQMSAREQLSGALSGVRNQAANQQNTATANQIGTTQAQGDIYGNVRTGDTANKQLADTNTMNNQKIATTNAENERQAQIEKEKIKTGQASDARKNQMEFIAQIGQGAAAASDKNVKKDIKKADDKVDSFLDAISKTKKADFTAKKPMVTTSDEKLKEPASVDEEPKVRKSVPMFDKDDSAYEKAGKTIGTGISSLIGKIQSNKAIAANSNAAGGFMPSDEDIKTDVKDAGSEVQSFLDAIGSHEYKYKDEAKGMPGVDDKDHISPMAQEFEKTEMGKGMVYDTPKGKVVDYAKSAGALFSSLAHLNEKIKKLEGK